MIPPATSATHAPNDPPDTFGARCAKAAALKNLIVMNHLQPLADLIDAERVAAISSARATAAGMALPPEFVLAADPVEEFGDAKKIPPTPAQVTAYSASIDYPLEGAEFCDSYAAKNWMVGRVKMKDWKAAVRNWKRNGWGHVLKTGKPSSDQPPRRAY